jgi:hypothetical protein
MEIVGSRTNAKHIVCSILYDCRFVNKTPFLLESILWMNSDPEYITFGEGSSEIF